MVNTVIGAVGHFQKQCLVTSMAHKTLKDQLRFHYQFYLLMNTVGRTEEAMRSLEKLEGVIEGIRPEIKAVNIDNLKQSAK